MPSEHVTADTTARWLQRGQTLETEGRFVEAVAAYDQVLGSFGSELTSLDVSLRRVLGLVWMNRGNALQKTGSAAQLGDAVRSYDAAIDVFQTLPFETESAIRNHLGAAW